MGRLLDKLLSASPAYEVRRELNGFVLVGHPDHASAFTDLVREAADRSGEEFIVFPVSDGHHGYSQMYILPTDDAALS